MCHCGSGPQENNPETKLAERKGILLEAKLAEREGPPEKKKKMGGGKDAKWNLQVQTAKED